jgi:H+/Cl- antiporter ClcA
MHARWTNPRWTNPVVYRTLVQDTTKGKVLDFVVWTGWMMVFTLLAVSIGHLVTPFADGSGLPQMKAYLGGTDLKKFFGWRVMFGKLFGLFCGQAAGLPIGKEVGTSVQCPLCCVCFPPLLPPPPPI